MKILGIGPSMMHDPASALLIDGKVVAAAEEERFIREKHAPNKLPLESAQFCLRQAKISPQDIDIVAFPWSFEAYQRFKFQYFERKLFDSPDRAIKALLKTKKICQDKANIAKETCEKLGIDDKKIRFVEHHLAHAASAYYFSGFKEASVLSIDGSGEFTATLIAKAEGKNIVKLKEIIVPDSLGLFYSTLTEYLGFSSNDGEYKLMGMAPYGDYSKIDFSQIIKWSNRKKAYRCSDKYIWVKRSRRYLKDKMYSRLLVEKFGSPRQGDDLSEPYIHIAARTQKDFENIVIGLLNTYLKEELLKHGNLCFAGGCALNVSLNRILLEQPFVKNLWVQPASHDAGASLGAAAYIASQLGEKILPLNDVYLGPEFDNRSIEKEIKKFGFPFSLENDISVKTSSLLQEGKIVGWFQGRMEFGPRALGNRSILGNATIAGTADKINAIIKFREKWRPFCPSMLKEKSSEILNSSHPAEYMTIAFLVNDKWRKRIPEVVHVDGTCRPQVVDKDTNLKFYRLIEDFYHKTTIPVVINTSLNRRGEAMVCSPYDALLMFKESGLEYLAIGDFLVTKK